MPPASERTPTDDRSASSSAAASAALSSSGELPTMRRVGVVQPIVAHYRVPVFRMLAALPGIDLEVWSDRREQAGSLQPAAGDLGFAHRDAPTRSLGPFLWQPAQLVAAKSGYDVLVLPGNVRYLHLLPALRRARRAGVRTIVWSHGYSKADAGWRRALRRRVLATADAIMLYNHAAAERLVAEGIAPNRLFVAPNSIDQTPIAAAREEWLANDAAVAEFRRTHGIQGRDLVVFISRMEPDKRVDLLVDAFAQVVAARPMARLALIGGGSARGALRLQADRLGLGDRVTFTGPIYQERELAPWCMSAACMAYPAAIGLSILHAFGYGLPVITSEDIPSHNPEIEALRPGENGLLYADGDASALAASILRILEDPALRDSMSDNALATVGDDGPFTLHRMVAGIRDAIAGVLALQPRR